MTIAAGSTGLVADIGGTNARFALARLNGAGAIVLQARAEFSADHYRGLAECLEAYLATLETGERPGVAAFGVASPMSGDQVQLTNRDWTFSISGLQARFGWSRLTVVNDFAALGHAVAALRSADWRPLAGPPWRLPVPAVVSLVGPGTGFGVGAVARGRGETLVLAAEGGHAGFAPHDEAEAEILRVLLARFPRVSNERILSGPGLETLYATLAEIGGAPAAAPPAPDIVSAALSGADPLAVETARRFGLILGTAMGDVALVQGAGAVAVAGGIAPRLIGFIDTPPVRARFEAKGRAAALVATIPIALIAHEEAALLGAARLLFPGASQS